MLDNILNFLIVIAWIITIIYSFYWIITKIKSIKEKIFKKQLQKENEEIERNFNRKSDFLD